MTLMRAFCNTCSDFHMKKTAHRGQVNSDAKYGYILMKQGDIIKLCHKIQEH